MLTVHDLLSRDGAPAAFAMRKAMPSVGSSPGYGVEDPHRAAILRLLESAEREMRNQLSNATLLAELYEAYEQLMVARTDAAPRDGAIASLDQCLGDLVAIATRTGVDARWAPKLAEPSDAARVAVSRCAPFARARGIEIAFTPAPPIVLRADAVLTTRAVELLLDFAIASAMGPGTLALGIRLSSAHAIVHLSGEGCGGFADRGGRLFHPFDDNGALPGPAELKLWLARLIVERQDGRAVALSDRTGATTRLNLCLSMHLN